MLEEHLEYILPYKQFILTLTWKNITNVLLIIFFSEQCFTWENLEDGEMLWGFKLYTKFLAMLPVKYIFIYSVHSYYLL